MSNLEPTTGPLTVAVSGATGLVGSGLVELLRARGHRARRLVRRDPRGDDIFWNPAEERIDADALAEADAVVHLAGENISEGRWNDAKKRRIRDSRVEGTALLANALASLPRPPRTFACASAIGYYGNRGDEIMDETSPPGDGFLAETCVAWEAAAEPARAAGIRVVNMRIGVVLAGEGGALPKIATPFKLGLGGPVGDGRQYMSWIAREDLLAALEFVLTHPTLAGPVNLVAPAPVTNREFALALGRVLGRPAVLPLPAVAVRLLFGEMGDELLLSSTRVQPRRLLNAGFEFQYPALEPALRHLLQSGPVTP
jgi:uncharacterized protein (TIGR01777 family)